jgi:hypothetical protein
MVYILTIILKAFQYTTTSLRRYTWKVERRQAAGKPFDCYGFYKEIVTRGGYRTEAWGKVNIQMTEVYRGLKNHQDGQGWC